MSSTSTLVGIQQPRRRHGASKQESEQDRKRIGSSPISIPQHASKKASTWKWWVMTVAALIVGGWAFHFMYEQPPGLDGYVEIRGRILANPLGWAHVGGGGVAMVLGPFQFLRGLRRTGEGGALSPRLSAHSWAGRLSCAAVLAAGAGSVDIIKNSDLYPFGRAGFVALGASWAATACLGWAAMWRGEPDVDGHRRWMTRNFALTYAAVMLRWQFPLMLILGMELKLALSWSGWASWVPNLLFVDYYVLRDR